MERRKMAAGRPRRDKCEVDDGGIDGRRNRGSLLRPGITMGSEQLRFAAGRASAVRSLFL